MKRFSSVAILAVAVITLIVTNARSQQDEDPQARRLRQIRENTSQNNFAAYLNAWNQVKSNITNASKNGATIEPTGPERDLLNALDVCVAEGKLRQVEHQLTELVKEHPDTVYAGKAKMALKALKFD